MNWLKEYNRWNFKNIDWVLLHYENCLDCSSADKCSAMERMVNDIPVFEYLKKMFEHHNIEVKEVKKNSTNNSELLLGEPYPGVPELAELHVYYDEEIPEFVKGPHYNFFMIQYKDGSRRVHTIRQHLEPLEEECRVGEEGVSGAMFQ